MWHRKPFTVPTDLSHLIFHQSSSNTLWPCPLNCALLPENTKLWYGHLSPAHQTHLSLLQLLWTHSSFEIWLQGHCLFVTSPDPYSWDHCFLIRFQQPIAQLLHGYGHDFHPSPSWDRRAPLRLAPGLLPLRSLSLRIPQRTAWGTDTTG